MMGSETLIKFCGLTREDDVRAACDLGVNALGFVMWAQSPRAVDRTRVAGLVKLLPPDVTPVAVLVTPTVQEIISARDSGARVIQIHGLSFMNPGTVEPWNPGTVEPWNLGPLKYWAATSLDTTLDAIPADVTIVLDAHDPVRHGGTGHTIDWTRAAAIAAQRKVMLAGGLTPQNVASAIRTVRPYGVDVASGIEDRPGIKNAQAMASFVAAVRKAEQE